MKRTYNLVYFLFCVSVIFLSGCLVPVNDIVENGYLDITSWNHNESSLLLNGKWEFYYNRLLTPEQFAGASNRPLPDAYVRVPGTWKGTEIEGRSISGQGNATYRIVIQDWKGRTNLGIKIKSIGTSYRLYANGKILGRGGLTGISKEEYIPQFKPVIIPLELIEGKNEVIINVSNYDDRRGGIWDPVLIDSFSNMQKQNTLGTAIDFMLFGSLIFAGIYHIFVYLSRKKDLFILYLSLFCITIAVRSISDSERYLYFFFQDISWRYLFTIEYASFILSALFFFLFLETYFREFINTRITLLINSAAILITAVILVFPPNIFTSILNTMYAVITLGTVYLLYTIVLAIKNQYEGARTIAAGVILIFVIFIYSITIKSYFYYKSSLMYIGALLFVAIQAISISRRYSKSFDTTERFKIHLEEINHALNNFVPYEFLKYLHKKSITDVRLGDFAEHEMTVLFSDIRSFTELSEKLRPEENFRFLNSYLKRVVPVIRKNNGFIDKYVGDSIMALFPENPLNACLAAIEMQKAVTLYNLHRKNMGYDSINIGIGIHRGEIILGTIGNETRMETTVISDVVNLASRLESLTKLFNSPILISEKIFIEVFQDLQSVNINNFRLLGRIKVKGKSQTTSVYEIYEGCEPEIIDMKNRVKDDLEKAIMLYFFQRFEEAEEKFLSVLEEYPDDNAAQYYLVQCSLYKNLDIDKDWDGSLIIE